MPNNKPEEARKQMKYSRSSIIFKAHKIPLLKFEDHSLTSFSGLVVLQSLFSRLKLKQRLRDCFRRHNISAIYGTATIMLQLVIHAILGYRELRDSRFYQDDPMVLRLMGLDRLPDVSTISRTLANADPGAVDYVRRMLRTIVIDRIHTLRGRLTLDFDGSVLSTRRKAEGTAVGFNKKKKGNRSYYPLFCTIAQTGQVFDVLHRSGNVHDSNGAKAFILACIQEIRRAAPHLRIEVRMDSAFFSDEMVAELDSRRIEFTISVPFERFTELKRMIESRKRWKRHDDQLSFFESSWKPKAWDRKYRFLFIRKQVHKQHKQPLQLDLFIPREYGYEFKVIVTNKTCGMGKVLSFHNGRGSQEGIFGEMKSQIQMAYIPVRKMVGNQLYLLSGLLGHNVMRELQMATMPKSRSTTEKRTTLWKFEQIATIRRNILQRAGRLTRPKGELTLTMNGNKAVKNQLLRYLGELERTA
jgi:hypothetical protein